MALERGSPAAWLTVVVALLLPHSSRSTFAGPFPGPDRWGDVPPATRRRLAGGRYVVYTLPQTPPRGVIVFLHGHTQHAYEWGFQSATCIECTGMPEEMVTVYQVTQRGYALIAAGPLPETAGPDGTKFNLGWPPESAEEFPTLVVALGSLLKELDLWRLPRYVMGSSSGSPASIFLASRMQFQGVGALLVGLQPEMCRDEAVSLVGVDAESGATWPFPPTLFLSVVLDHPIILRYMKNCVEYFLERGVIVKHIVLERRAIPSSYFAERVKGIDLAASERIHQKLRVRDALDDQAYVLWEHWDAGMYAFVEEAEALNLSTYRVYDEQLLRVYTEAVLASQAGHEQNAGPIDDILNFFEATTPVAECPLLRRHANALHVNTMDKD